MRGHYDSAERPRWLPSRTCENIENKDFNPARCHALDSAFGRDRDFCLLTDLARYVHFFKLLILRFRSRLFGLWMPLLLCPHRGRRANRTARSLRIHFTNSVSKTCHDAIGMKM